MKKINIILLLLALLINPLFSENKSKNKKEKDSNLISVSYFIPGIKQIEEKRYIKGILFLSSFIGSVSFAIIENNNGNSYYEQYLKSTNIEEIIELRDNTEKSYKKRNYFLISAFSIWILHLLDLKFFTKKSGVTGEINKDTFSLGIYLCF